MGLRQTSAQVRATQPISLVAPYAHGEQTAEAQEVRTAGRYSEQRRSKDGPNAGWENHVRNLAKPAMNYGSLTNVTEAERTAALAERAARRAYDGAPPVVPHPISQASAAACLACHGEGVVVKDKVASKISHPPYSNCTQCHVPASGTGIPTIESPLLRPVAGNEFVGLDAPLKGSRAWPQAPPTIPHSTQMRSDCLSCHGPQGLFGLRTPHPERQACVQCHAPGAELDQRQFFPAFTAFGSSPSELSIARQ